MPNLYISDLLRLFSVILTVQTPPQNTIVKGLAAVMINPFRKASDTDPIEMREIEGINCISKASSRIRLPKTPMNTAPVILKICFTRSLFRKAVTPVIARNMKAASARVTPRTAGNAPENPAVPAREKIYTDIGPTAAWRTRPNENPDKICFNLYSTALLPEIQELL